MAGLFSFRNERYKQIIERIQHFIIAIQKAEEVKRDEIAMDANHFCMCAGDASTRKRI